MASDDSQTRRSVLKTTAATAAAAGIVGVATAHTEGNESNESSGQNESTGGGQGFTTGKLPIILAGRTEYWYGITPQEIEGKENPTLKLKAGEKYEIVWVNTDAALHELIVESGNGKELAASGETGTAGEAVSTVITASEEMSEYYCKYHPESMRGSIELNGGFDLSPSGGGGGNQTDGGNQTGGGNTSGGRNGGGTAGY